MSHEFIMPDLQLDDVGLRASVWLVSLAGQVVAGDGLLEVVAGDVAIDLPAPVSGRLTEQRVVEDEPLRAGQVLGIIG